MQTTSFHKSNLGTFGENLPCDIDGYVHLTAEGWINSRMDWGDYTEEEIEDRSEELAENARKATEEAEKALAEWQAKNF